MTTDRSADFPPYELLHDWSTGPPTRPTVSSGSTTRRRPARGTRARYSTTGGQARGIHVPEDKREAMGHVFTVILWGELAAWNIAADLARALPT